MVVKMIPFQVETRRVIELLAKQIYQSPLALLRENAQNAYDAVLLRRHREMRFPPRIEISLSPQEVRVTDNGVGMTSEEVSNNYWRAGSSGKNNEEARAAGVVGTFGIGAMANFGIAEELIVETESATNGERTRSRAILENLSLHEDCVELEELASTGEPGTTITAQILPSHAIDVAKAKRYIEQFVRISEVPVEVNEEIVSGQSADDLISRPASAWQLNKSQCKIGSRLSATVNMVISQNADVWLRLTEICWSEQQLIGSITLRSGQSTLQTFCSGFGLATTSVGSTYQFGGIADLRNLQPTAGREALTTDSMQFLQSLFPELDGFVSRMLAERPESDASTPFMAWVSAHGQYELCGNLRMSVQPGDRVKLREIREWRGEAPTLVYGGSESSVIKQHATEERPLLILARNNPRRQCEMAYLAQYCETEEISDLPVVVERKSPQDVSLGESAFVYRVQAILDVDYFLKAEVELGKISHNLPIFSEEKDGCVRVTVDPEGQTMFLILGLYDREYSSFGSMIKDFVRTIVFPSVADYIPSSKRQGAEEFLRAIRKPREVFEIEDTDLGSLPSIWADYKDGRITMNEAVERSLSAVSQDIQVVESESAARIADVVPDVISNIQAFREAHPEANVASLEALPAITRLEISSEAKILTIGSNEVPLQTYRCFLSITDDAREQRGDFFLQPHKTSVVWGGQKVWFIFQHHSGRFSLYYDLWSRESDLSEAGGGPFPTCTIVLRDRIYVPIPHMIQARFIPRPGERKRFEVRHDILRVSGDE